MKYLVPSVLLFIIISMHGCTYTAFKLYEKDGKLMGVLPLLNSKVVYRARYETVELPKEEVFRRARRWCVLAYRSAKDVLQLVDKETGEIIGKGYSTVTINGNNSIYASSRLVYHTITIDVGEDAYDVTVGGLEVYRPPSGTGLYAVPESRTRVEDYNMGTEKSILELFHGIDTDLMFTIESLHKFIQKPTP